MTRRTGFQIYADLRALAIKAYYADSILVVEKLDIEDLIELCEHEGSKAMYIDVTGALGPASGIELRFGPVTVHAVTARPTPSQAV